MTGAYVDSSFYYDDFCGTVIPLDADIDGLLRRASRHIDTITFNRIVAKGFANLTPFQKEVIKEVVCDQAEFEYKNQDIFDMVLQGYNINGVSMTFGESWNVKIIKGIPMRRDTFGQLSQTGLCCRLAV